MIPVNPQKYNLPKRIKLRKDSEGLLIIIDRKSRVIMKDARGILKTVSQIKALEPKTNVRVLSKAPVCGKTKIFLSENNITITLI